MPNPDDVKYGGHDDWKQMRIDIAGNNAEPDTYPADDQDDEN